MNAHPEVPGYVVEGLLGQGGMGAVYAARERSTGRPVVIKLVERAQATRRLVREARALGALRHPGIVRVHDAGELGRSAYLVLERLEGEPLSARLAREVTLPLEEALAITRALGEALTFAHGQGTLHRDVKPENVMLAGARVVLIDFGLTKSLLGEHSRLTATEVMAGTLGYAPPEQMKDAAQVDARADLYALAATCYAMLTGHPPGQGATPLELLTNVELGRVAPPSRARPELPRRLDAVLLQALSPDPARRYPSVRAFVEALDAAAVGGDRPRRPVWTWAAIGAVLALVGVGLIVRFAGPAAPTAPAVAEPPPEVPAPASRQEESHREALARAARLEAQREWDAAGEIYRARYAQDPDGLLRAAEDLPTGTKLRIQHYAGFAPLPPGSLSTYPEAASEVRRLGAVFPDGEPRAAAQALYTACALGVPWPGLEAALERLAASGAPPALVREARARVLLARDRLVELQTLLAAAPDLSSDERWLQLAVDWRTAKGFSEGELFELATTLPTDSDLARSVAVLEEVRLQDPAAAVHLSRLPLGPHPPEVLVLMRAGAMAQLGSPSAALDLLELQFQRGLFLRPILLYQQVRMSLVRDDHERPERREVQLLRLARLVNLSDDPLIRILGARIAFLCPSDDPWFLAGTAWLDQAAAQERPEAILGAWILEELRTDLPMARGLRALGTGASEAEVLECWRELRLSDLGDTPRALFERRFGRPPPLPE
ncbi:MAG: serine/threonine-protein kinase [Planctomycetota bacterium]